MAGAAWRRYRSWKLWIQAAVGLVIFSVLLSPFTSKETDTEIAADATTTEPPSTTTEPVSTTPTTEASPARELENLLLKKLGKSNRKVRRVKVTGAEPGLPIVLRWAIDESLTEGYTKDKGRRETVEILGVIRAFKGVDWIGARLEGTYSMVDKLGNSSEDRVFLGEYSRDTIERINFEGFDFKNAWEITDEEPFIHPAFQY